MKSAVPALVVLLLAGMAATSPARAERMTLSMSDNDFVLTSVYGDIEFFTIDVEIDRPLAPGLYVNPPIIDVTYQVKGTLPPGAPSGSRTLNLQRYLTGPEFYAQGSSLRFEISQNAVLIDGVQIAELAGTGTVLTFNAREINTGRYAPPILTLEAGARGQLQNSNNVPSVDPLVTVDFGEEYISNLLFDPGNTTIIRASGTGIIDDDDDGGTICIISSIVSGTYLEPGLKRLREFRDRYLMSYEFGQHFVAWYYRVSPGLAHLMAEHATLRVLSIALLTPLICSIEYPLMVLLFIALRVAYRRHERACRI